MPRLQIPGRARSGWSRLMALRAGIELRPALAVVAALLGLCPLAGAAQSPLRLTGEVEVGLQTGTLRGNVCLSGFMAADTVTLVLNRSLTIEHVEGGVLVPLLAVLEAGGDAVRHRVVRQADPVTAEATPAPLCVAYAGSERVYDVGAGSYRDEDSSRVIAFNGTILRARGSARWFPTFFDPRTGLAAEAASFRLRVRCPDCTRLYMNGGAAMPGPEAIFESDTPLEPYLLAGDFAAVEYEEGSILGETVPADTARRFLAELTTIRRFYEDYLDVPFAREMVVVRIDAVREPRQGRLWGFFSDPSLTLIGMSIGEFVEVLEGPPVPARRSIVGFLAHELAHRYFGWGLGSDSPQRDLFSEPFATYLELKAVRQFIGDEAYDSALRSLARRVGNGPEQRSLDLSEAEDFGPGSYRYGYAPLQLFTLEAAIGEPLTRALLRAMIMASPAERAKADFAFIRRTALDVGVPAGVWDAWEQKCLRAAATGECLQAVNP